MPFIVIFLLMAGEAYAAGNPIGTATSTPSTIENVSPEAIFDQIRGFLTFPAPNLNVSVNAQKIPNFDTSGVQNLNGQIRDITGVDVFQFLRFFWNVFLALMRYLLESLPKTAG